MLERIRGAFAQHWPLIAPVTALLMLGVGGLVFGSVIQQRTLTTLMISAVLTVGLYIFSGNSGILSFGHMSFMAVGAYVTSWLTMPPNFKHIFFAFPSSLSFLYDLEYSWVVGLGVGLLLAALFGLLTGVVLIRLSGIEASISTLALLLIVNVVASNAEGITQGQRTMVGVPQVVGLGNSMLCAIGVVLVAYLYQSSRMGQRLRASREDENAAAVLGINVGRERLGAFVISAALCGVGGVLYAHFSSGFSPNHFFLNRTFIIIAMLIVGGRHSLAGAVTGVIAISITQEMLRQLEAGVIFFGRFEVHAPTGFGDLLLGFLMLIALITRPDGIVGRQEIRWPPHNPFVGRRRHSKRQQVAVNDHIDPAPETVPDAERSAAS